jgi:hypothetical protein
LAHEILRDTVGGGQINKGDRPGIGAERRLVRALGALIKWDWVTCDERQKEEGHRFWHNAYLKTELANLNETISICEAIGAECALYRLFALHYNFRLRKS